MDSNLAALLSSPDTSSQSQALLYFNQLLEAPEGWTLCADFLQANSQDQQVTFFCLRVLEEFSKTRYAQETADKRQLFRNLLLSWFEQTASSSPSYLLSKKSQIVTQVFLLDYPDSWPGFFSDVLSCVGGGGSVAAQLYLETLLCMNEEVMDKSVPRSAALQLRANLVKDRMRDDCVSQMVESWFCILSQSAGVPAGILCSALRVVGLYAQWIDLAYVINSRFLELFSLLLGREDTRISVVETLHCVANKGMDRAGKLELIELTTGLIVRSGVFHSQSDIDFDLHFELARYLNVTGTQLISACQAAVKETKELSSAGPYLASLHGVFSCVCAMLSSEDDGVSENILPCLISYVTLFKSHKELLTEGVYENIGRILLISFEKLKFDESHDFANDGENEILFLDYRKELRVLLCNICMLLPQLVLAEVDKLLSHVAANLASLPYMDVEAVLYLIYLAEEYVPWREPELSSDLSHRWSLILTRLLESSVSLYPHQAVSCQFIENIVRFVPFLRTNPGYLPLVLSIFLDERGIKNPHALVRSRACFLLARFLKDFKLSLREISVELLNRALLVFGEGLLRDSRLGVEDLRFLYESAGILVMFSATPQENKGALIQSLLAPILDQFLLAFHALQSHSLQPVPLPVPPRLTELSRSVSDLMRLASFASKCVSSEQMAEETRCSHVFLHLLEQFSKVLTLRVERETLQEGFRTFLHRMVIVLGSQFLPFLPDLLSQLLAVPTLLATQECCILLNQIISSYPARTGPHLAQLLPPCIAPVLGELGGVEKPVCVDPTELFDLAKSYLSLCHTLTHSSVLIEHLLQLPPPPLHSFLSSLTQLLLLYPSPAAQKQAAAVLKRLVSLIDKYPVPLLEFSCQHLLPALFLAPAKRTFNLSDGQTSLLLNDIISTSLTIIHRDKDALATFLTITYLPSLSIRQDLIQQYLQLISQSEVDFKTLKNGFVLFYSKLQSLYQL